MCQSKWLQEQPLPSRRRWWSRKGRLEAADPAQPSGTKTHHPAVRALGAGGSGLAGLVHPEELSVGTSAVPNAALLAWGVGGEEGEMEVPRLAGRQMRAMSLTLSAVLVLLSLQKEHAHLFICFFLLFFSVSQPGQGAWLFFCLCAPESTAPGAVPGTEQALQTHLLNE